LKLFALATSLLLPPLSLTILMSRYLAI
jgi:hypothetical protein